MSDEKRPGSSGDKRAVVGDLNLEDIKLTIRRDFKEVKEFFLEEERIRRLEGMGKFKRTIFLALWLFKELFLRLTLVRRLLLILAMVLLFVNVSATIGIGGRASIQVNSIIKIMGGLVLLFILMMELKDKLLARDELVAGRSVQLALMPETSPDIPGWDVWLYSRPANDVGGDLIDYIQVDSSRFGLALGDVAGKGLPAALFMAKLQATLRALVTESDSLAKLGTRLNEIFHRDGISRSFASLVYLELQPDSGRILLLNAGHPPPLVLKKGRVQSTDKGDMALGILPHARYASRHIDLQKGDILVVYSDGVTEAQDEADEFFGTDRFFQLLPGQKSVSARELGAKILAAVDSFIGEARFHDDLSLMILKRE